MTDTNLQKRLRIIAEGFTANSLHRATLEETITALSARASAGEGGEWTEKARQMIAELRDYVVNERDAQVLPRKAASYQRELDDIDALLTAAPQPAQAGASGGVRIKTKGPDDFASHVCPAESAAVWNACVYEHERIAEGLRPILSSTEVTPASPATGEPLSGSSTMFDLIITPQPAAAQGGMAFAFMAEVCDAAVQAMQANGLIKRTIRLQEVRDQLRQLAAAPQPQEAACQHKRSFGAPWRCAKCGHRYDDDSSPSAQGEG